MFVADGFFADLRGLFFNISDDSLLSSLSINKSLYSDVTTFSAVGGLTSVGSKSNNINGSGGSYDFAVEIGDEGIGKNKRDIRSTTFVIEDASKKLNVNSFSEQSFAIRMMSVGTSANSRGGSSKLSAINLPPVAITTTSPKEEKPVEIPEPGTTVALVLAVIGAMKFTKRKKEVVA